MSHIAKHSQSAIYERQLASTKTETMVITTTSMIRDELNRLLAFEQLNSSRSLCRFLEFIVDQKLSDHEQEIKEYTIGVKALGRSSDFNPQVDAIVRIHAGRLRRILTNYYKNEGKDNPLIISIPKGAYIPFFTTTGNYPGDIVDISEESVNETGRSTLNFVVIPFHNFSPDNSNNYFVQSLGEQLSIELMRLSGTKVTSYYYSDNMSLHRNDLVHFRDTLNAEYVLTGSLRITEKMTRISVQIVSTHDGAQVWAEYYDKELLPNTNLFTIQDEVIEQVVLFVKEYFGLQLRVESRTLNYEL